MADTDWWETFRRTGCVEDYLSYKGIYVERFCGQPGNRKVGEGTLESVNNCDRDDTIRSTYR